MENLRLVISVLAAITDIPVIDGMFCYVSGSNCFLYEVKIWIAANTHTEYSWSVFAIMKCHAIYYGDFEWVHLMIWNTNTNCEAGNSWSENVFSVWNTNKLVNVPIFRQPSSNRWTTPLFGCNLVVYWKITRVSWKPMKED